jgi:hypothetical protein
MSEFDKFIERIREEAALRAAEKVRRAEEAAAADLMTFSVAVRFPESVVAEAIKGEQNAAVGRVFRMLRNAAFPESV